MGKKACPESKKEKLYVVRFFNAEWDEGLKSERPCSAADAMIELALWLKSRSNERDDNTLSLCVYRSLPYFTLEELA